MLTFGKYKGMSLKKIASTNVGYIKWCMRNIDGFEKKLDAEDLDALAFLKCPFDILRKSFVNFTFDGRFAKYIENNGWGRCAMIPVDTSTVSYVIDCAFGFDMGECDKDSVCERVDERIYNMLVDYYNKLLE